MYFIFRCLFFLRFFSLLTCTHFLGGSLTYQHIEQNINSNMFKSILVEIRFHVSDPFFHCTSERINQHRIVYLIEEYRWNESIVKTRADDEYYDMKCISERRNQACEQFKQQIWGYCENANVNNGYSIVKRQFSLLIERFKPMNLYYVDSRKNYSYFNLSIETDLIRINSSPYPYLPAVYYVPLNQSRKISIVISDDDGDEILCEPYHDDRSGFLTVHVDENCQIDYANNQSGKQFGQFWLMDRYENRILSRSLITLQVHVLENLLCNVHPQLLLPEHTNHTIIKLGTIINVPIRLQSNCSLIKPADQTITEITTWCSNNPALILANGGIEVLFQCQFPLCKFYRICFVGEIGLKLPATNIKCLSIEVIDSMNECTNASNNYDSTKPHSRHIIFAEPLDIELLTAEHSSQFRNWFQLSLGYLILLFSGMIVYCGCKQMLLSYSHRLSCEQKSISNRRLLLSKHEQQQFKNKKHRTDYLRLGSIERNNENVDCSVNMSFTPIK